MLSLAGFDELRVREVDERSHGSHGLALEVLLRDLVAESLFERTDHHQEIERVQGKSRTHQLKRVGDLDVGELQVHPDDLPDGFCDVVSCRAHDLMLARDGKCVSGWLSDV